MDRFMCKIYLLALFMYNVLFYNDTIMLKII